MNVRQAMCHYGFKLTGRFGFHWLGRFLLAGLVAASVVYGDEQSAPTSSAAIQMTLTDAVNLALRSNRTIESAYLDRVLQKFDLKVAEDKFYPDLNLTTGARWTKDATTQKTTVKTKTSTSTTDMNATLSMTETLPTGGAFDFSWTRIDQAQDPNSGSTKETGQNSWRISLQQPLLKGAGISVNTASVSIARLNEQSNILNLKSTLMNTVTSVIRVYRNFHQTQRQLEISQASVKRAKDLLKINQALISVGRMAATEIVQTEADVAAREFDFETALNSVDSSRLDLLKILDIGRHTRIDPVPEGEPPTQLPSYDYCIMTAFANRPDYLQTGINREVAAINLMLAKNNRLWDLSLQGAYSGADAEVDPGAGSTNSNWKVGLQLQVPIYGDLSRRQAMLSAETGLKKVELNMQELTDNIAIEVQDALREVKTRLKQVEMATRARELSERKLEIEQQKLKVGRSTNFQLVSFQNDLVSAQNNELNAILAYRNTLTALDQVLGTTLDTWQVGLKRD